MQYGICSLSIIPLRKEPSDSSEMGTQLLYGEFFKVLEVRKNWSRIRTAADSYEGWIHNTQFETIPELAYQNLDKEELVYTGDLIEYVSDQNGNLMPVAIGSVLNYISEIDHHYDARFLKGKRSKENLVPTAFLYLNSPYLWGGKTPFGIDCSGLTQMVYRLNGYNLHRDSAEQATQGESLSFIEESEPGDLAFFDNKEGVIDHVGIIMKDNHIIHAHGKVRIDRIDHTGIYNTELRKHTHQLRVIKKII